MGADPLSLGPGVTTAAITRAWDRLIQRANQLDAPKSALSDLYRVYASISVAASGGAAPADVLKLGNWGDYNAQLTELEAKYPKKSNFWWAYGGALLLGVGVGWYWRRRQLRGGY